MKPVLRVLPLLALSLARPVLAADVLAYLQAYQDVVECPRAGAQLAQNKQETFDLRLGDTVITKTAGANVGKARVFFEDRTTVLLAGRTEIRIGSYDTPKGFRGTKVNLDEGRIRVFSRNDADGHCEVTTPTGTITCEGTDFVVTYSPETGTEVLVISGVVGVRGAGGTSSSVRVHAYELTRVLSGQAPTRPEVVDDAKIAQDGGGLELIGGALPERLPFGTALVAGANVLPEDDAPQQGDEPWGPRYREEEPGVIVPPLFPVPGSLMVSY